MTTEQLARRRASQRKWREAHPLEAREAERAWRQRNRDRELLRHRRYQEVKGAGRRAYRRAWNRANRAYKANHEHLRRLRKRDGSSIDPLTPAMEQAILSARTLCPICGKKMRDDVRRGHPRAKQLDHILPIAAGGAHTPGNVRVICGLCNQRRPRDGSDFTGQLSLFAKAIPTATSNASQKEEGST